MAVFLVLAETIRGSCVFFKLDKKIGQFADLRVWWALQGVIFFAMRKKFTSGRQLGKEKVNFFFSLASYRRRTYGSRPSNAVIENIQPEGWIFSMVGFTGLEPVTSAM